jgi:glutamate dehydrogenase
VVQEEYRYQSFRAVSGLLERSISWLLRNQPSDFNVSELIKRYKTDTQTLMGVISRSIIGRSRKNYLANKRSFIKYRLPAALAQELVDKSTLASAFDIIEIKTDLATEIEPVAKLFYAISERLQLHWIRGAISQTVVRNHWNHLAILNLRNDLHANQHNLTELVLQTVENKRQTGKALALWEQQNAVALERYDSTLNEFSAMRSCDFQTISVAVSEVRRLVQLGKRGNYD